MNAPRWRKSSIFLRRIIGSMSIRVNSKCAHQVRPTSRLPFQQADPAPGAGQHLGGRLDILHMAVPAYVECLDVLRKPTYSRAHSTC